MNAILTETFGSMEGKISIKFSGHKVRRSDMAMSVSTGCME